MATKINAQEQPELLNDPIIKANLLVGCGYGEISATFNPQSVPEEFVEKFLIYVRNTVNAWPMWKELTKGPTTH
jgi:hypothetical protein